MEFQHLTGQHHHLINLKGRQVHTPTSWEMNCNSNTSAELQVDLRHSPAVCNDSVHVQPLLAPQPHRVDVMVRAQGQLPETQAGHLAVRISVGVERLERVEEPAGLCVGVHDERHNLDLEHLLLPQKWVRCKMVHLKQSDES